ncbi:MAG: hypothetical protein R3B51_07950 [Thermodesulfobacteriota bacterium]
MSTFLITVLAGLIATSGMSILMWAITRSGVADADMIRAIGTIFTRSEKSTFTVGLVTHYIVGVIIAFAYVALISVIGYSSVAGAIGLGFLISVAHGVAFGFVLVIAVAEHHPWRDSVKPAWRLRSRTSRDTSSTAFLSVLSSASPE